MMQDSEARKPQEESDVKCPFCLSENTEVLTARGYFKLCRNGKVLKSWIKEDTGGKWIRSEDPAECSESGFSGDSGL